MTVIVQKGHRALRKTSRPVKEEEFGSEYISNIVTNMKNCLEGERDGVALAAPQIGENIRLFIISWKVFAVKDDVDIAEDTSFDDFKNMYDFKIFINPEIVNTSKKIESMDEGCLSVRPLYGKVERASKARIRAQDEKGEVFEMGGSGLLAQIFQHEIDHLDGILFIDKAKGLYNPDNE